MDQKALKNIGNVETVCLDKALGERYLSYALSTITARSLPDVRDGLKPVHRRILYAMKSSGNTHNNQYRKSANAVGYVMMHYHPHGDAAIYDSLVRMAQDFSMRYPLVDGQGNFGSIDGDNAAAFRYTEARLHKVSEALLEGIDENAVDFQDTYNGQKQEPRVLPTVFPNLLANGASGIAVGMATNIPPHNVGEICDVLRHLIKMPHCTHQTLMSKMPGPDFPTGGVIVEPHESLFKSYETGRGSIRLRAKWQVEVLKGGSYQVVVTEIPFQVQKARLIEKIADLMIAKKLPLLSDVQDESAADIRIVFFPKSRNLAPEVLMESLFKNTELETRFALNMNVLDAHGVPRVMSLRDTLQAFLNHRHHVLIRRSHFQLDKIEKRLEILHGFQVAYLNIDEVIRLIREEDDPKPIMMERWNLTDLQTEAILNMKLRNLRKLEEIEIQREISELSEQKKALESLLSDTDQQWKYIDTEIKEIKQKYGDVRRTQFAEAPEVNLEEIEAIVEKEPITVVCSDKGWIRSMKGHLKSFDEIKYRDGDQERFVFHGYTTDKILVIATNGRSYTLSAANLPAGRGHGEPISLSIDLPPEDTILKFILLEKSACRYLMISSDGRGFFVDQDQLIASTKNGKQIVNCAKGEKLVFCEIEQGDHLALIGTNRKLLIIPNAEIPSLQKGRGVTLQKYKGAKLSDAKFMTLEMGLNWPLGDRMRHVTDLRMWLGKRAGAGKLPPAGFPRDNTFGVTGR